MNEVITTVAVHSAKHSTGHVASLNFGVFPTKVKPSHLDRLAIVYVRQSTQQQVLEHRESTARQYALVDRAVILGWPRDRVLVIDEDLGQSGASSQTRNGFQRLFSEISKDAVGLVLGLEMSRLSRSGKDWHALLELCAIYQTLLADTDGVYDPSDHNDRLLLGLKGTMSEAELHVLKNRMYLGLCNKAARGEVLNHPPIGYVRTASGDFAIDPDEQVQAVVRIIFDRFAKWGTISGLLKSLVADQIRVPVRPHFGADRGQLQWRRPNRITLLYLMRHPIYAGAYRWGHREVDAKRKIPGRPTTGKTLRAYRDCRVLIQDRFDPYITWAQFEANQRQLNENGRKGHFRSSPRRGASLLAGLLQCGRCGRSMTIGYACNRLRYSCQRGKLDYGEETCQSLSGTELDQRIGGLLLEALRPASIALSINAANDLKKRRAEAEQQWQHQLARINYETELAHRQYAAVDPDNRLVARELERRWEETLRDQEQLRLEYRRFADSQPSELTAEQVRRIKALSRNITGLWNAKTTQPEDRQVIARTLLDRVIVTVEEDSDNVDVEIRFAGGFVCRTVHRRPVESYDQLSNYGELVARVEYLKLERKTLAQIAVALNAEGFRPPKRATSFNRSIVCQLMRRERERCGVQPKSPRDRSQLQEYEWWLPDLAMHLKMPVSTMHRWRKVGWVIARKISQTGGHWAIFADDAELMRLKQLRNYKHGWCRKTTPTELSTPTTSRR
jgi:DNA invertase Pin-like site-specific DNA recombinase